MRPITLTPNQPRHFYRGGANIARFRGAGLLDDHRPEDWLASATCRFGAADEGLTVLPDGRRLTDAIAADPEAWLGPGHLARWGATPAVLVKLLDPAQRLPVHCHPGRAFARDHLDSPFGKTEAWLIVDAPAAGEGRVYLGFGDDVPADRLRVWSATQDPALLAATNPITVRPGDAVLVPAGLPHAIDAGVFLVELQEPTDFSVLLEWKEFAPDGGGGANLRLGWDTALACVDRSAWSAEAVRELVRRPSQMTPAGPGLRRVFPIEADPYFRAQIAVGGAELEPGFAVLVALRGTGELAFGTGDRLPMRPGQTVLVPYAAGASIVGGDLELLRCLPPSPDTPTES